MRRHAGTWLLALAALAASACATSAATSAPRVLSSVTVHLSNDLFTGAPQALQFVADRVGYVLRAATNPQTGGGQLQRTLDGGQTWHALALPAGLDYVGMRFFTPMAGVLWATTPACGMVKAGCAGVVLRTRDGGRTFHTVLRVPSATFGVSTAWSPGSAWLAASRECFETGCAVDSLYATSDAGASWTKVWSRPAPVPIAALATADGRQGYAIVGGSLLVTRDGGRSFTLLGTFHGQHHSPIQAVDASLQRLRDGVMYVSACDALAVGNGGCENYLYRSTDGGATFRTLWSQYCTYTTVVRMRTPAAGALFLLGSPACEPAPGTGQLSNVVRVTRDGFRTTRVVYAFHGVSLDAIQFAGSKEGWAVGAGLWCGPTPCPTVVYHTTDGGLSWSMLPTSVAPIGTVAGVGGGGYYAIGAPTDPTAVLASPNGRSWRIVGHLPAAASANVAAGGLQMVSASQGYLLSQGKVWRMTDGGGSFAPLVVAGQGSIASLSFPTRQDGYLDPQAGVACPKGQECPAQLLVTHDGGRSFAAIALRPQGLRLGSVAFASRSEGYGVGPCPPGSRCQAGGVLYQTFDGGAAWQRENTPPGLGGLGAVVSGPKGYVALLAADGFAVLTRTGWHIVRLAHAGSPYTGPYGPSPIAAVVPGPTSALVLVPAAGVMVAPYTANRWHSP